MDLKRPAITLFTSISNIGPALRQAAPSLSLVEIVEDDALVGRTEFDASRLLPSTLSKLQEAEILITDPFILAQLLERNVELQNLKWCQSTYAGVDPLFPLRKAIPSFTLTRFAGAFGPPMAEWCLARIISHERRFDLSRADQFSKQWAASKEVLEYRYLSDLTLTILGCGEIGLCIARAAKAFGMRVVGYVRQQKHILDPALDESVTCLTTALQQADYIVNVLPSTKETRGLLSLETLGAASRENGGKCPVLVNVGRGDVTDTKTLCTALDQLYLEAAILDVLEQEPLPPDNPLWTHPKVTISPHVSAMTRAQDVPKLVLENYRRYVDQQPLLYVVDWNKTY